MNIIRGPQRRAQRVNLYGQEGVGKSTYISRLPQVLFLDTEEGTHRLNVDRVPVRCLADLRDAVCELQRDAKRGVNTYRVLAIDTADRLWDMCAADVCAANHWDSIESPGYGKGMKMATEKFLALLDGLDLLVAAGINVVLVCHCKVERMSPPDLPEYTMYQPKVSAPGKQAEEAKEKLKQWCDMLLFARFETSVNNKTGKAVGGEVLRRIETQHTSHWEAKCRGALPPQLTIDNADAVAAALGLLPTAETEPNIPVNHTANVAAHEEAATPAESEKALIDKPQPVSEPSAAAAATVKNNAGNVAVRPAPHQDRKDEPFFFQEEEDMLIKFFVARGALQQGQTLKQLPANVAAALKSRPQAALEKASQWMASIAGKGVAA